MSAKYNIKSTLKIIFLVFVFSVKGHSQSVLERPFNPAEFNFHYKTLGFTLDTYKDSIIINTSDGTIKEKYIYSDGKKLSLFQKLISFGFFGLPNKIGTSIGVFETYSDELSVTYYELENEVKWNSYRVMSESTLMDVNSDLKNLSATLRFLIMRSSQYEKIKEKISPK